MVNYNLFKIKETSIYKASGKDATYRVEPCSYVGGEESSGDARKHP